NALTQDGDLSKDARQKRSFIRAAIDWKPITGMTLQGYYSHGDQESTGNVMGWGKAAGTNRPSAPDADKNWAQPWTSYDNHIEKLGGKFDWNLNEDFGIRAAYQRISRDFSGLTINNWINGDGTYTTSYWVGGKQEFDVDTGYLYLDYSANILGARNKLTVGYAGYDYDQFVGTATRTTPLTLGTTAMGTRVTYPKPEFTMTMDKSRDYFLRYRTYTVGDELNIGKWSVLVGLSHASMKAYTGDGSYKYDEGKTSPSGSLIYKPYDWLSTYVSYTEALDIGGIA
ncbi:MAG TPA: TonB-dependent receptor, partial [Promineifilum sp.]|nr:TonB-dependent receptor [Promineifilum sp.]